MSEYRLDLYSFHAIKIGTIRVNKTGPSPVLMPPRLIKELLKMHFSTNRNLLLWVLSTAALFSPLAAQTIHNIWEPPLKHGIAAVVEDRIITYEEIRRQMSPLIGRIQQDSRSAAEFERNMEELYLEVLQSLVDKVLVIKDFYSEEERVIPRSYVENEYDRIIIEDFGNDRRKFLESLRSEGKNPREFRRELEEQIIVSVMTQQMRKSQSEISPEKIEDFYNQNKIHFYQEESVHLRLIMLKPFADESSDLLRQTAEKVTAELESGVPFATVAENYSQDSRRKKGGDWGWINRPDLRDELSEVAFSLDTETYSPPITLGQQYYILYVEDRREEGIQPLDEVRDRIENILAGKLQRQAQKRWKERLRRDAFVKYY